MDSRNLKGTCRDVIDVQSREENLSGDNSPAEIQTEYLPNTSHDYYRDIDQFCPNVYH
jgi:hypothetical protein